MHVRMHARVKMGFDRFLHQPTVDMHIAVSTCACMVTACARGRDCETRLTRCPFVCWQCDSTRKMASLGSRPSRTFTPSTARRAMPIYMRGTSTEEDGRWRCLSVLSARFTRRCVRCVASCRARCRCSRDASATIPPPPGPHAVGVKGGVACTVSRAALTTVSTLKSQQARWPRSAEGKRRMSLCVRCQQELCNKGSALYAQCSCSASKELCRNPGLKMSNARTPASCVSVGLLSPRLRRRKGS